MLAHSEDLPDDERGVDAAEGEVVDHDVLSVGFPSRARDVVEIAAAGIRLSEVEIGREPALPLHQDAVDRLESPGGAQGVSHVALEGGERHALPEYAVGGL